MKSKIFEAETIQRAIARVKEELGPDAMILSTCRLPKNPKDPYAKTKFAVEAAPKEYFSVHDSAQNSKKDTKNSKSAENDFFGFIKDDVVSIKDILPLIGVGNGIHSMMLNHPESVSLFALLLRAGVSEKRAGFIMQNACHAMEKDIADSNIINCHTKSETKNSQICDTGKSDGVASLKNYVIKECVRLVETKHLFPEPDVSGAAYGSDSGLCQCGDLKNGGKERQLFNGLPYMAAFVGPTGVGKTTTIAKLAAELTFKRKKKVGLISIDNYRVGAFEQLKVYASIMGIGCIPAFSKKDFSMAVDKMRFMDIILIDTAGHSHADRLKMGELAEVVNGKFNVSVHLVLSVTTGFADMRDAASSFAVLNPETYIFTKIDETKRCGKIFDQVNELKMPVSLVTNGQRVPEDLIIPDKKKLLSIVLGTGQNRAYGIS